MEMRRIGAGTWILAAGVIFASLRISAQSVVTTCSPESFATFEREYAAAQNAFQQGKPEPIKALWSHEGDVTLMGAYGGHERGWDLVGARLSRIAPLNTVSTHESDKMITRIVGANLAIWVQLEHIAPGERDWFVHPVPGSSPEYLRVTHVARCEGSAWRIVLRHADPLMEAKIPPR